MKFLIVDDEHELYKRMYADLANTTEYDIEETPRMVIPSKLKPLYNMHFNERINRHMWLPLKCIWTPMYRLHTYKFDPSEAYCVIFLNGSLRFHYSQAYLEHLKRKHSNVKLAMIMYDSFSNPAAKRAISFMHLFDYVFSFDQGDCEKHDLFQIYSTFSKPNDLYLDKDMHSSAFFIGYGQGRLDLLQETFKKITGDVTDCKFYIAGVKANDIKNIPGVIYNQTMSYYQEMLMAYNSNCIVEIVRKGQTGVTLRTCEAIAFNKKLLTNNTNLLSMPFYDSRYMQVFSNPDEIDTDFINQSMDVKYEDQDYFSPLKIIKCIQNMMGSVK